MQAIRLIGPFHTTTDPAPVKRLGALLLSIATHEVLNVASIEWSALALSDSFSDRQLSLTVLITAPART
jgi:hypothetical protein